MTKDENENAKISGAQETVTDRQLNHSLNLRLLSKCDCQSPGSGTDLAKRHDARRPVSDDGLRFDFQPNKKLDSRKGRPLHIASLPSHIPAHIPHTMHSSLLSGMARPRPASPAGPCGRHSSTSASKSCGHRRRRSSMACTVVLVGA